MVFKLMGPVYVKVLRDKGRGKGSDAIPRIILLWRKGVLSLIFTFLGLLPAATFPRLGILANEH